MIERLVADPNRFGGESTVERAVELASRQQADLRRRAFRLGATLYAERTGDFVDRIESYWRTTLEHGPELTTGGITVLAALDDDDETKVQTVELARKFLVGSPPHLPSKGEEIRQGYLAIDGSVAVRVRQEGERSHTFTAKAGSGPVRTELEWSIEPPPVRSRLGDHPGSPRPQDAGIEPASTSTSPASMCSMATSMA